MKTNIEAKFKLIEILNISPVELSYIKDLTIPENIVSELLNGESGALKVHLENIQNDETLPVDTRLLAACLKNRMKDSVIRIKMDGLDEDEDDEVEEENYGYFDEDLTEEEKDVVRRGRNAENHHLPKNANVQENMYATAYEALLGYLYLTEQSERLQEILKISVD